MKKKLLSLLMATSLLLSCLPAASAAVTGAGIFPAKSMKVLIIGNSFSNDATTYLYDILKAEGMEQVVLGNLYIGGCSIALHARNAKENKADYLYYKNDSGTWQKIPDSTLLGALQDEDWELILFQQNRADSGLPETMGASLDDLIAYVNANKTNPNAKLGWHMVWANQATYSSHDFVRNFNNDQWLMYECMVNSVRQMIATRPEISVIIPSGTAIQNARATVIGDDLNRDGYHLNTLGRVIASYTWYATLTGRKVETVHYTDVPAADSTPAITISPEQAEAIAAAVNAAVDDPYNNVRPLTPVEKGCTYYLPYAPAAGEYATGFVFGSKTVADGTQVLIQVPAGTDSKHENLYYAHFWEVDDSGKLVWIADADGCNYRYGLHDVITAASGDTVTLTNSSDGADRGKECAADLKVAPDLTVVDFRAAVVSGAESTVTTLEAVKTLCDEGKAAVNAYVPDGTAEGGTLKALIVLDHTLKVTVGEVKGGDLLLDAGDGKTVYGSLGSVVSVSAPAGADYSLTEISVDGQKIKQSFFPIRGNHVVTAVAKELPKGDVYYFLDPVDKTKPCRAIVLYSETLPLGYTEVTPVNGTGTPQSAHHFWEMTKAETAPLKRFAGTWTAYGTKYRFGYHDVIAVLDREGKAVTLSNPPVSHRSRTSCTYSKPAGYEHAGCFDERCGDPTSRGYECAERLTIPADLKLYDLRADVAAGLTPAVTTLEQVKELTDAGKAVVNVFAYDGTKSGGTLDAVIVIDNAPYRTRAEMVQAIYEAAGKPETAGTCKFPDVDAEKAYYPALCWAAEKGVVAGYGGGAFQPDESVTVEQVAVMLYNYAGKPDAASAPAVDGCSDWAQSAMRWCAANGIFSKVTYEKAGEAATCAQTAQMLANFLSR